MRALVLTRHGDPDGFELREVPDPEPGPGEVLIRVAATSVNPVDTKLRGGGGPIAPELPGILGMDVAGTIEAVGDGVTDFQVDDEIYGCAGGLRDLPGALAERMVADARLLAPKPPSLSLREAAALPLVSITAWDGLIDRVRELDGRHVLVYGGTGGVGHVALQLARARGARVAATGSSPEKLRICRDLGADEVIDYREEEPKDYVERLTGGAGFDVAFDSVGGDHLNRAFEAAGLEAEVVSIVTRQTYDLSPAMTKGLTLHCVFMLIPMIYDRHRAHHGEILRGIGELVEAGELRPLLDPRRFGLADGADAHRLLESGEAVGKIVIDVG